jgi:hypothetical protein
VVLAVPRLARVLVGCTRRCAQIVLRAVIPEPPRPNYLSIALLELELTERGMTCWRCGRVSAIDAATPCAFCGAEMARLYVARVAELFEQGGMMSAGASRHR